MIRGSLSLPPGFTSCIRASWPTTVDPAQEFPMAPIKPGWSKPSTILFASEFPANEKAFAFALAQAAEFGSDLVIFHVSDSVDIAAQKASTIPTNDYAQARAEKQRLEPLALRAGNLGVHCSIVV